PNLFAAAPRRAGSPRAPPPPLGGDAQAGRGAGPGPKAGPHVALGVDRWTQPRSDREEGTRGDPAEHVPGNTQTSRTRIAITEPARPDFQKVYIRGDSGGNRPARRLVLYSPVHRIDGG